MNSKVNNWAVELEQFRLHMWWIPGSWNLLADSLSHLIDMVPDAQQPDELKDHEFGSCCFEELEPAKIMEVVSTDIIGVQTVSCKDSKALKHSRNLTEVKGFKKSCEKKLSLYDTWPGHSECSEHLQDSQKIPCMEITEHENVKEIALPLKPRQLQEWQKNDAYYREIAKKLHKDQELQKIFIKENGVLYRLWIKDGRTYRCILVPEVLQESMLILAHDYSGHNGSRKTYNCLKKQYYWPGLRKQVFHHCKKCAECILQNQGQPEKTFSHFILPDLPMEFICMDLVGPIHPPSSRGNKYILTVIDMLTGFTMAVPIPNKNADTICDAYRDHIYCTFGGSSRILMDNRSEFKNKEMKQVCESLGVKHIFSPVYTPESNGCLEGWHCFFKACITKHIQGGPVEWDELVPLAVSAYNFFPCQSTKESPFVLMFRRDLITPVVQLLEPKPRYYGKKEGSLKMDILRKLYTIVVENIHKAKELRPKKIEEKKTHSFKVNDLVLVKDPDSAVFEPRFQPNYRVTAIFGDNQIEVQDERGHKSVRRSSHVKYVVIQQLPNKKILQNYGRSAKLLIAEKDIPSLGFQLEKHQDTSECGEHLINSLEGTGDAVQVMECDVLPKSFRGNTTNSLKYSKASEHSIDLLNSAAGVTVHQGFSYEPMQSTINMNTWVITNKGSECLRNSRETDVTLTVIQTTEDFNINQCEQTLSRTSEYSKHSIHSLKQVDSHQNSGKVAGTVEIEGHGDSRVWDHKCS